MVVCGARRLSRMRNTESGLEISCSCVIIDLFNNEPAARDISDFQEKNLDLGAIEILSKKFNLEVSIIKRFRRGNRDESCIKGYL